MDIRTFHSANSLISCVLALILNFVLLWLVLKRSPKEMQVYSRILIQTVLVDLVLSVLMEPTQPIVFMKDGWTFLTFNGLFQTAEPASLRLFLFLTWLSVYMFSIFGLVVQFVYRYLVLAKNANISMCRYLAMLSVPAFAELIICFLYSFCAVPTPKNAVLPGTVADQLLGDRIYIAFAPHTTEVFPIITTGLFVLLQITCYTVIAVCGYLVVKFVRENAKLNPAHKEMNRQLTLNLILQAILPSILCMLNVLICATAILLPLNISSSLPMLYAELFSPVPMHWLPVFNPLVTMVVVKPFRRTLLCVKTAKTTLAKNVVAVPVPVPKTQMVVTKKNPAGRSRVATISIANPN